MKIKYSKERLNSSYKLGLYFVIMGIIVTVIFTMLRSSNKFDYTGFELIIGGVFSMIVYFFENKKQYLKIENGVLTKNTLFPKKISLKEINQIKKFAGDYILKTNEREFIINTQIMDRNSLIKLNQEFEKLNIKWLQKSLINRSKFNFYFAPSFIF